MNEWRIEPVMTRRDHFAAAALPVFAARYDPDVSTRSEVCRLAWLFADDMIAADPRLDSSAPAEPRAPIAQCPKCGKPYTFSHLPGGVRVVEPTCCHPPPPAERADDALPTPEEFAERVCPRPGMEFAGLRERIEDAIRADRARRVAFPVKRLRAIIAEADPDGLPPRGSATENWCALLAMALEVPRTLVRHEPAHVAKILRGMESVCKLLATYDAGNEVESKAFPVERLRALLLEHAPFGTNGAGMEWSCVLAEALEVPRALCYDHETKYAAKLLRGMQAIYALVSNYDAGKEPA